MLGIFSRNQARTPAVLGALCRAHGICRGRHILHTGNKANRFYLIETGQVSVQTPTPAGRQLGIQLLGPGDILGWSWIYPTYVWSFDAKAQTSGDAIFFHANQIRAECERDDALACALFKRMAKVMLSRLHHMQQGLVHLADHQWPLATPMA